MAELTTKTTTAAQGELLAYYGFRDRPLVVGTMLYVTNEEMRVMAELVGNEASEAREAEHPHIADFLINLSDRLLAAAEQMDAEAARS